MILQPLNGGGGGKGWRLEVSPEEAGRVTESYLEPLASVRRTASLRGERQGPRAELPLTGSLRLRSRIDLTHYF